MKNNINLTIICRSYNCEKYIYSALKSLATNLDSKCEVIIVDNGSTDKTLEVIEDFKNKEIFFFELKFIKQENSGPGGSCNTGLDLARGNYIGFLDCDDIFLNNFKSVLELVKKNTFDIIEYGFVTFVNEKKINLNNYKNLYVNLKGAYFLHDIIEIIFARTNWYPFIRFYSRKLWVNVRFPKDKAYEDDMTIYKIFLKAKTIFIVDQPILAYRQHSSSITAKHTAKQLNDLIQFYWDLDIDEKYKKIFQLRIARAISYFSFELKLQKKDYKKIFFNQKKYLLDNKIKKLLKKSDLIYYSFPKFYDFINWFRLFFR
jgi:glycosyltransferase involved in cell wall biosynthesis